MDDKGLDANESRENSIDRFLRSTPGWILVTMIAIAATAALVVFLFHLKNCCLPRCPFC